MAVADHLCAFKLLEAPHTPGPPLEIVVVALNPLLLHLARDVLRFRHNGAQCGRIGRRRVRRDAVRTHVSPRDRLCEEGRGRDRIPRLAQVDIDHLAVLVDGAVGIDPPAGQADVGLIDGPAGADAVAMRAGRVFIQRDEALHPVEDARRINVDTPFGQKLRAIGVGQTETQLPAHGERDEVVGEAIPVEGRGRAIGLTAGEGYALVDLPACAVASGLDELLLRAPLAPHAGLPLPPRQATAYPISARPNDTSWSGDHAWSRDHDAMEPRRDGTT